jgi:putative ABC transport system permease protein
MKYLPILWASLQRKRVRTWLTLASIAIAFVLYVLLQTLRVAFTGGAELAGVDRLVTMHKVTFIQPLPESYLTRTRGVAGVRIASPHSWFGGVYQDDRNQIVAMAVDETSFFDLYPEYLLPEEQQRAWLSERTGAIVGPALAQRFGWQIGDVIPLRSNIYTNVDGTQVWPIKIVGIYESTTGDVSSLYLQHKYLDEARTFDKGMVGWIVVKVDDPDQSADVARRIDALFANSSTETKTSTEKAFAQSFANQMGDIGAIVTAVASAVFFTLLLVIANTMGQSVRERTSELAVMKTLGFSSTTVTGLVIGEALLLTLLGAAVGLTLGAMMSVGLAQRLSQFFPALGTPPSTFVYGALIAIVLGVLASAIPAAQAWQLRIVDALRRS